MQHQIHTFRFSLLPFVYTWQLFSLHFFSSELWSRDWRPGLWNTPQKWSKARGTGGAKSRWHSRIFQIQESHDETMWQHWTMIIIIISIMIMNVEYIWLTLPKSIQFKVSPAVTYDFNQLIYAACSRPADLDPFPASLRGFLALPYSVKKTFPVH